MKNQITYTEHNGLYYPDLALPEQTNYTLGKHSNLRIEFIKKHRRGTYTTLLTQGRLNEYLRDIDKQSHELISSTLINTLRASFKLSSVCFGFVFHLLHSERVQNDGRHPRIYGNTRRIVAR